MTKIIMENGQAFELTMGGKGNAIVCTGGGGQALPQSIADEICSKEFWDKMDAIRETGKQMRNARG